MGILLIFLRSISSIFLSKKYCNPNPNLWGLCVSIFSTKSKVQDLSLKDKYLPKPLLAKAWIFPVRLPYCVLETNKKIAGEVKEIIHLTVNE